jgi:hypothetical protein
MPVASCFATGFFMLKTSRIGVHFVRVLLPIQPHGSVAPHL